MDERATSENGPSLNCLLKFPLLRGRLTIRDSGVFLETPFMIYGLKKVERKTWLMSLVEALDVLEHGADKRLSKSGTKRRLKGIGGVCRIAFAFDPERKVLLLVAGDKSGIGEQRFYQQLIRKADHRFDLLLDQLKSERRTRR